MTIVHARIVASIAAMAVVAEIINLARPSSRSQRRPRPPDLHDDHWKCSDIHLINEIRKNVLCRRAACWTEEPPRIAPVIIPEEVGL